MFKRTVSPEELDRLWAARQAANLEYNEALTAVDRAVVQVPDRPHPPPAYDEHQITPLNQGWDLLDGGAQPRPMTGWRGRARAFLWDLLGPIFERQRAFNSMIVDHLNRNVATHRITPASIDSTVTVLHYALKEIYMFRGRLMPHLQILTAYINSRDDHSERLLRRLTEDCRELIDILDHRTVGLAAGLSGLTDEVQKRWESMLVRERRYEARVAAIAVEQERSATELQTSLGVLQRATQGIRREIERRALAPQPAISTGAGAAAPPAASSAGQLAGSSLESHKYVGFEDQFRGSEEEIRARVAEYLPFFEGASDVLDLGCGRGEFLQLLRGHGISARGLDINHEMVQVCRAHGLDVAEGDALGYLRSLPDASLGGLFAAQVVEHLEPEYLLQLLDVGSQKLRPGARIVLETINPACWAAFFDSYIRDITHVRPLHPDTLRYLLIASGFLRVDIRYRAPYPDDAKLQPLHVADDLEDAMLRELADTINGNVEKINRLLFTYLDYAAIGQKA